MVVGVGVVKVLDDDFVSPVLPREALFFVFFLVRFLLVVN